MAMWIVGIFVLVAFILVNPPTIFPQRKVANRSEAMNNMRSIGLAMLEFDQEFGSFPNDDTAKEVIESTSTEIGELTGPHSNPYFRQLIAFGIQTELMFYAPHPENIHRPDSIMTAGKALAPGEVGMSYVYGLSTSSDPRLPLLLSPMKSGTHQAWRRTFGKKAAVLLVDRPGDPFKNPPHDINRKGQILLADGSLLLDPSQPYWHGRTIDIRHPEIP